MNIEDHSPIISEDFMKDHSPMVRREYQAHLIAGAIEDYVIAVEDPREIPDYLEEAVGKLMQLLARRV